MGRHLSETLAASPASQDKTITSRLIIASQAAAILAQRLISKTTFIALRAAVAMPESVPGGFLPATRYCSIVLRVIFHHRIYLKYGQQQLGSNHDRSGKTVADFGAESVAAVRRSVELIA